MQHRHQINIPIGPSLTQTFWLMSSMGTTPSALRWRRPCASPTLVTNSGSHCWQCSSKNPVHMDAHKIEFRQYQQLLSLQIHYQCSLLTLDIPVSALQQISKTKLWCLLTLFSLMPKQNFFFPSIIIWSRKRIASEQKLENVIFHDIVSNELDYRNIRWS